VCGNKVFPVAIGELGSRFTEVRQHRLASVGRPHAAFALCATSAQRHMLGPQANDVRSLTDMAAYLNCDSRGDDGRHEPISSWFYWCWNVNSGDTGGLVRDDWTTLEWVKLAFLTTLGLRPWAMDSVSPHNQRRWQLH